MEGPLIKRQGTAELTRSFEGPSLLRPGAKTPLLKRQTTMGPALTIHLSNESIRFKRRESLNESMNKSRGYNALTAQAIRKELLFDYQLKEKLAVGDGIGKKD